MALPLTPIQAARLEHLIDGRNAHPFTPPRDTINEIKSRIARGETVKQIVTDVFVSPKTIAKVRRGGYDE